ncbi:MAG: hypothetical protein BGO21_29785 [Dyadobacter sp. 50-39]|nr:MAG: hypothetical protein BGO21_29785 [Dyadobacter sp. 50-39]
MQHGRYYDQENAASKPCSGNLTSILIASVPFLEDFDCSHQAEHRANGIHQISAGFKVGADLRIGFLDSCRPILCQGDARR